MRLRYLSENRRRCSLRLLTLSELLRAMWEIEEGERSRIILNGLGMGGTDRDTMSRTTNLHVNSLAPFIIPNVAFSRFFLLHSFLFNHMP
jgi:hypothetical protein